MNFDIVVANYLNHLANQNFIVKYLAIFWAHWLIYVMAAVVFIFVVQQLGLFSGSKRRLRSLGLILIVNLSLATLFSLLDGKIISYFFFRSRPFLSLDGIKLLIDTPLTAKSFPSDHATMAFAIAVTVLFLNKRLGLILLVCAFGVALGRVLVGVHYPTDVLVGAILGSVWALVVFFISRKMGRPNL